MANPHSEPWAPDAAKRPGELGERGSSAFAGSHNFSAYDATPNAGATRAVGGEFGDAPTVHSDPAATPFTQRGLKGNQTYEDTRSTQRTTAAAVAPDA